MSKRIISYFIKNNEKGNLIVSSGGLVTLAALAFPADISGSASYSSLFELLYTFVKTGQIEGMVSIAVLWCSSSALFSLLIGARKTSTLLSFSALAFLWTTVLIQPLPIAYIGSGIIILTAGLLMTACAPLKV